MLFESFRSVSPSPSSVSRSYQLLDAEQPHPPPWAVLWQRCGTWRQISVGGSSAAMLRPSLCRLQLQARPLIARQTSAGKNMGPVTEVRLHHCPHALMWHSQSYQHCPPPPKQPLPPSPHLHTRPTPGPAQFGLHVCHRAKTQMSLRCYWVLFNMLLRSCLFLLL